MSLLWIASSCSDPGLQSILAIVKRILSLIQIIGPILALVSFSIHLTHLVRDPDDKKRLPKLRNSAIALLVLFFIPMSVNVLCGWLDDSTVFSSCWNSANYQAPSGGGSYVSPNGDDSKSPILSDSGDYQKGDKKKSNSNQSSTGNGTGDRVGDGNSSSSKVVFIGDSRTVQMYAYLKGSWSGANYSSGGVHVVGEDVFVSEGGMGLNWMRSTGIPAAQPYFQSGTAIVILMGVNDLGNIDQYISYVNANVSSWKKNGSSLYYVSVNPCDGKYSHLNSKINTFNEKAKNGLSSEVGWIDTYGELSRVGFKTTDGLHYDKATYQTIYNYIKSKV
ncbi:MAG: SGNH/GDSL hydrolase family protein [Bacilli bacterium]|nr:SGNH/GDSL hydrolase family protein [Bacilli bacterium]